MAVHNVLARIQLKLKLKPQNQIIERKTTVPVTTTTTTTTVPADYQTHLALQRALFIAI
jgi:hypothetical protein